MPTPNRYYSSSALPSVLSAAITSPSATTFTIPTSPASLGWPSSFPYQLSIDPGTVSTEIVLVTAVSGSGPYTLTVTRGVDGTSGSTHSVTTSPNVYHSSSGHDFGEYQAHAIATGPTTYGPDSNPVAVHGIQGGSAVVGTTDTQTLTNKSLTSPAMTGSPTAPTATALDNTTKVATTAYTDAAVGVETSRATTAEGLKASLASPALTGTPTAPTATALTNSTQIATTAYTDAAVAVEASRATTAEGLKAPLASPALTGNPTAPTQAALNNSTRLATTAYTDTAVGVETTRASNAEALLAPLASPALTGTPTAPTKTALTNNTDIATTAYADAAVAVENSRATTAEALKAPLASPTLTGTPAAPTASAGTNTTQLATTAFVTTAVIQPSAPVTLTDASTVAVNAALGNLFRLTLTASGHTIGVPSNPVDGQRILFEIIQPSSGGPDTVTWSASTGGYEFSTALPAPVLSTAASKHDFIGFIYNSTANLWYCLSYAMGY